jgi:putative peptidoglycan lipid II flippase
MFVRSLRGTAASALHRALSHPVTRAAAGFTALTSLVKAVAFLKEAVVASAFGVGSSMDSYLMALVVIGFPSAVLVNAAQTVFIREYVRVVEMHGQGAASRFLRVALLGLVLTLTALLVIWVAFLPAILGVVGHGLDAAQRSLVAANVYRLIPYYYLNGINLLGYGVLQARRAFLRSALIPILTPLVIIALIASAGGNLDFLIGALTLGTGIETVFIVFLLVKFHRGAEDSGAHASQRLREFAWGTVVLMPGTLFAGLSPVIEQTIASGLGHGAISALGYAGKLPSTLNSLLTTAVGVTILPYFSQRLVRGYDQSCRRFFIRYATLMALVGTLVATAGVLGSEPFVRVAFQRGQFSPADTLLVTALQRAYLWQLPGALAAMVATRFIAAQGRYRIMTLGAMLIVPATGLVQWSLSIVWGAQGLAFGTSVGTALTALLLIHLALRVPLESAAPREAQ